MSQRSTKPHLIWLYPGSLVHAMDAATWLDTTNELRKVGWRVTLVAAGPSGQQRIRGTDVFCIPRPKKYLVGLLVFHMRFLQFLRRHMMNVDIILFNQMSALWLLPVRPLRGLAGRQGPLLVMDIRSLHMPREDNQGWKGWLRGKFQEFINRSARHWIDGYLTITHRMSEAINIPPQKLWGEWPSGVNPDLFGPPRTARCWPLSEQPIHLVYIGALEYERNLMTLCQTVEKANAEGMLFTLLLVGNGTERTDLELFAARCDGRIRVAHPVSYDEVPEILAWAHLGVLPFPDEEKFRVSSPIKLFEYMATGLPILATRIACHTDVIGSGKYVFWAERADISGILAALRLVWMNRGALPKIGSQAAIAVQAWTWYESAKKLKQSLEFGLSKSKK